MTIGHQKLPTADHPFLRHCPGLETQCSMGSETRGDKPLTGAISDDGVMQSLLSATETWNQFCALVLNVDPPTASPPPESLDKLVIKFIRHAKETHGAIGGYWKDRLYLCALPDVGIPAAVEFAEKLVAQLAGQRPEPLSIGLAPFPILAYDKQQAWNNACKALDHGTFLGPGSIVPLDAVSLNISGDRHYQLGEMDMAITEYSAAIELDHSNTNVRNSLGVCFAELDDRSAARARDARVNANTQTRLRRTNLLAR